ncbi:transposase IS200 family protein [Pontibacter ummariensis]|uniref:Transposase IS200 like n=2 Tax=Pontibacter ummariensis TaxID=1610492 RepID=A0A239KXP7_9BACT|nr:transposase IS200 family protein [Pontibacter ummariensis]SNT22991.1 Transposase IS200 like [Pontibacter ummariensis]
MAGIVQQKGCKLLAIYYMPDHCHILIGLKPDIALSDLIRDVKANSTKFIKEKSWTKGSFQWQEGFGAFSYAQSQLAEVRRYIQNQEEHHRQRSFQEEYLAFLQKYEVDYDERYLFK